MQSCNDHFSLEFVCRIFCTSQTLLMTKYVKSSVKSRTFQQSVIKSEIKTFEISTNMWFCSSLKLKCAVITSKTIPADLCTLVLVFFSRIVKVCWQILIEFLFTRLIFICSINGLEVVYRRLSEVRVQIEYTKEKFQDNTFESVYLLHFCLQILTMFLSYVYLYRRSVYLFESLSFNI